MPIYRYTQVIGVNSNEVLEIPSVSELHIYEVNILNQQNKRYVKFLLKEIKKAEDSAKKSRNHHVAQPFDEYATLCSICNDGFLNDTANKWEYKELTDRIKDKCLEEVYNQNKNTPKWRQLYWETLRAETFHFFESFLYYMELKRPYEKKFYEPRAKTLKTVVLDLQNLEDGKYKFYGLSLPARTGKSTICVFFLAWIVLRHPESHSAMGGHSGVLADHFYKELLDLFTTEEYAFIDLYAFWHPNGKGLVDKSADKDIISFESQGDFPTLTCRGIDGTWTGAVDISSDGYLYVDDLVRDRTHSLSPTRMKDTFSEYINKMRDRKNDGAKELMVGTLWNVLDPLMRMEEIYGNDPDYFFRRIPALDYDTDESNFAYDVKGFSTEYYRDMREMMIKAGNEAEWWAKFQQRPYNREGLLFPHNELGFFNGILPEDHKFEYVTVCDVAFGGGDNVSMPIGLKDKTTGMTYIVDWYYNSAGVQVTVPGVADKIISHNIKSVTFERNNGGLLFAKQVQEELQKRDYICACDTRPAPNNISKQDKIKACEGKIKTLIVFLDGTTYEKEKMGDLVFYERSPQYDKALNDMETFVTIGKNLTDDAADSIAQLCLKAYGDINQTAEVETLNRALLGF